MGQQFIEHIAQLLAVLLKQNFLIGRQRFLRIAQIPHQRGKFRNGQGMIHQGMNQNLTDQLLHNNAVSPCFFRLIKAMVRALDSRFQ